MQSSPRRTVQALADAIFEPPSDSERLATLATEALAFVSAASFASRVTLRLALALLWLAPLVLFTSFRTLDRLDRGRRGELLQRVERTPLGLALVAWRTILMLHFYEDREELTRIGYREERKRHLAVVPVPLESGVRLRGHDDRAAERKGAA